MIIILLFVNGILGFAVFQTGWSMASPHLKRDELRDKHHMAWRRDDATNWSYWRMLPFALTIFFPRMVFWAGTIFIATVATAVISIFPESDFTEGLQSKVLQWAGMFNSLALGYVVKVKRVDCDYTKWLGPNYTTIPLSKCSTIVANHTGF